MLCANLPLSCGDRVKISVKWATAVYLAGIGVTAGQGIASHNKYRRNAGCRNSIPGWGNRQMADEDMSGADEDMSGNAQKIAENVLLLAVARVSMAFSLPLIGFSAWLGGQYLESKFEVVNDRVTQVEQATRTSDRLIAVETKQAQDAVASEKFQNATLTRLDRVQDSIVGLSNTVAALTAPLQAVAEERNRSPPAR